MLGRERRHRFRIVEINRLQFVMIAITRRGLNAVPDAEERRIDRLDELAEAKIVFDGRCTVA